MDVRSILLVAAGGAVGATARYGSHHLLERLAWPLPTLAVNLVGAFLLGALLLGPNPAPEPMRLLFGVGLLGAFTTLSAYSVEVLEMWRAEAYGKATLHILGNGIGGPAAAALGWLAARVT